jgi:uncharacterized membrane protein YidH (DUF202 family)
MSSDALGIGLTSDRRGARPTGGFFFLAHVALLVAVFVGFAPTFYLRPLHSAQPLPMVLYLHGAVLTCWFLLTVLQGWLIRTKRHRLHRQIGFVIAGYAVLVVAMGLVADLRMASEIRTPQDGDNFVVWGNFFSLVLFTTFVSLAVVLRNRPDAHRRLILLASISIVGPALARFTEWPVFPGGMGARPFYGAGGLLVLYGALIAYDLIVRRRPHPASWIGALAMFASLATAVFLAVSGKGFHILHGV